MCVHLQTHSHTPILKIYRKERILSHGSEGGNNNNDKGKQQKINRKKCETAYIADVYCTSAAEDVIRCTYTTKVNIKIRHIKEPKQD